MIFIPDIALVLNTDKKKAFNLANRVIDYFKKRNISFYLEKKAATLMEYGQGYTYQELKEKADIVIVIGGDGTFLHTAHYFMNSSIPILGINVGRLGFLTEIEPNDMETALEKLINGNYSIEKRMILEGNIISKGENVYHNYALNDFVIHRGSHSRLVTINLYINSEIVSSYRADGIIIATPTGSTAYSLSAGGPIINPRIRAIIITPICPHNLHIRPMLISDKEKVKIGIIGDHNMGFNADGSNDFTLQSGDEILIEVSKKEVLIAKLAGKSFYSILHEKMKIGLD